MSHAKQVLSKQGQAFLQKLQELDLEPIAYQLMHPDSGMGWTRSQTSQAIVRYLMFLYLVYLYPNRQIIPTREIDKVWHYHILDTSKYAEDCQMLFGRFIHHFPYLGLRDEVDRQNLHMAFQETQVLFEEHFGAGVLGDDQFQQPADCEPLRYSTTQRRPHAGIEATGILKALCLRLVVATRFSNCA
jgi:hypothetical protein